MNTKDKSPSKASPYQRLVFSDDFNGGSGECYTMKPRCLRRGDWFAGGECPFDDKNPRYAGLKDLNKCVWKPYHNGTTSPQLTNMADAVEVKSGMLRLKILPNPDYDPAKGNCGDPQGDPNSLDNLNKNCKLMAGGVDSKYYDSKTHGQNSLYGRTEMRARFISTTGHSSYPALWMWPDKFGEGHPHIATSSQQVPHSGGWNEPKYLGEIDILEADGSDSNNYMFMSYHQWEPGTNINAFTTKGRTVKMNDFHTYGVEWSPSGVKFYIDDCYVYEIKNGEKSTHGSRDIPYVISDTASYMMMSVFTSGKPIDLNNRDVFEIDEVRIYE